jgi:predicted nucleic acid-binding protein
MPFRNLLDGGIFSAEQVTAMGQAYEAVRQKLHDRDQPAVVNGVIAGRIIELAKREALTRHEAERALASLGLAGER